MKKNIFILFLMLLGLSACSDRFFDINENPNNPLVEKADPVTMLPMVLNATAKKMTVDYGFVAHWLGYWARGGSYGQSIPLENYAITTTYQQNNWVNGNTQVPNPAISWYDILMDATTMAQRAEQLDQPFYVGVAKVVRAIGFMYLVDMYNNVPYTEAFNVAKHMNPAYDKGAAIYSDLLLELDTAAAIFNSDLELTAEVQAADILFSGNLPSWRKLVNTQRLKLLIHQSAVLTGVPATEIAKTADDGFLQAGETAEVQPGYSNNQYQQNPFYGTFLRDHNGSLIDDFNRANNYVLNTFKQSFDVRYKFLFSPASNPQTDELYVGRDLGGRNFAGVNSSHSSNVAGPGLARSPTQAQWLFTSVESLFLQAEAAQRGWLPGVNARDAYTAAVKESYVWLGVTVNLPDGGIIGALDTAQRYLDKQSIASWPAATDKLALIVKQKYLALTGINNFEAWVDYRRLGIPADVPLSLNASAAGRQIPLRLLYPQDEYSFNPVHAAAEGTINAQTSRIFWDVD